MLIALRATNCFLFDRDIELSMHANRRYTRLPGNVADRDGVGVLKSAVLLGPNNTGKTMLTRIIAAMRDLMLNKSFDLVPNFSNGSATCDLSVCFLANSPYRFDVHYDPRARKIVFEQLSILNSDLSMKRLLYTRDYESAYHYCEDKEIENLLPFLSQDSILIYLLQPAQSRVLTEARDAITTFASSIDVITTERLSMQPTIQALMNDDTRREVRDFVCGSDPSFLDFRYDDEMNISTQINGPFSAEPSNGIDPDEATNIAKHIDEMLRLVSVYKDHTVPSVLFDSHGTQTIEALAGYVIWALRNGRILVIDELDSGLHFRLTRAIITLFNNERNTSGQLIATTHDVLLLDCKRLFRKDQIWFTDKDKETAYLYSLADFTSRDDGVRETSDLVAKYKAGKFGAVPEPDMFSLLANLPEVDDGE